MRTLLLTCTVLSLVPLCQTQAAPADSVVMVHAKIRGPNVLRPWVKSRAVAISGTGVVLAGNKILTNAHLVHYATEVEVQSRPGQRKYPAKVEGFARDMDLAVLSVKSKEFFKKHPPLPRAENAPKVQDTTIVYGFPIGGDDISVTRGLVSRMEYARYTRGGFGLRIQVSAAINQGNSGGPALIKGKMIGLVFGQHAFARNTGYVIPNEEIDLFLNDIKDGKYDGKPDMQTWALFQYITNDTLREKLKLKDDVTGVMVVPSNEAPKNNPLRLFDVVTKIGPYAVDNEGMIRLPGQKRRMPFYRIAYKIAKNGTAPLSILRAGKQCQIAVEVSHKNDNLIRGFRGEKPSYFIYGPLVFSPVRADALSIYDSLNPYMSVQKSPLLTRVTDLRRFPDEELVVVTRPMFEHKCVRGYNDPKGLVVREVNGHKIKNIGHLITVLRDLKDKYVTFRFAEDRSQILVLRRAAMEAVTREVMEDNGIPTSRRISADLQKFWERKAGGQEKTIKGHSNCIHDIAIDQTATHFVSGCADGKVKLWSVKTKSLSTNVRSVVQTPVTSVCISPNGKLLAISHLAGVISLRKIHSPNASPLVLRTGAAVYSVVFSKDGKYLASGVGDSVGVWEIPAGRLYATLKGHSNTITSLSFSSNSRFLVSGSGDASVIIWDISTKSKKKVLKYHKNVVRDVVFLDHGNLLASGSLDKGLVIWNWQDEKRLFEKKVGHISSFAYCEKKKLLCVGTFDKRILFWDVTKKKIVNVMTEPYSISSLSLSKNGNILLIGYGNPFGRSDSKSNQGFVKIYSFQK